MHIITWSSTLSWIIRFLMNSFREFFENCASNFHGLGFVNLSNRLNGFNICKFYIVTIAYKLDLD